MRIYKGSKVPKGFKELKKGRVIKLGDIVYYTTYRGEGGFWTETGNMGFRVGDTQSQFRYARRIPK